MSKCLPWPAPVYLKRRQTFCHSKYLYKSDSYILRKLCDMLSDTDGCSAVQANVYIHIANTSVRTCGAAAGCVHKRTWAYMYTKAKSFITHETSALCRAHRITRIHSHNFMIFRCNMASKCCKLFWTELLCAVMSVHHPSLYKCYHWNEKLAQSFQVPKQSFLPWQEHIFLESFH